MDEQQEKGIQRHRTAQVGLNRKWVCLESIKIPLLEDMVIYTRAQRSNFQAMASSTQVDILHKLIICH